MQKRKERFNIKNKADIQAEQEVLKEKRRQRFAISNLDPEQAEKMAKRLKRFGIDSSL